MLICGVFNGKNKNPNLWNPFEKLDSSFYQAYFFMNFIHTNAGDLMEKFKQLIQQFSSLQGSLFRYSLSYSFLLALFPGLFTAVILYQYAVLNLSELLQFLTLFVPAELIVPFVDYLMMRDTPSMISGLFSLGIAIYVASQSLYSFLLISAEHEGFHTMNVLIRIKAVLLFLFFILSLALTGTAALVFPEAPFITAFAILFLILTLFYKSLSFKKRRWPFGMLGAFAITTAIMITGVFFFWIIQNFTSYQNIYGPLASVMILFLSVYVISSLIYFGFCLNLLFPFSKETAPFKQEAVYRRIERTIQHFNPFGKRKKDRKIPRNTAQ